MNQVKSEKFLLLVKLMEKLDISPTEYKKAEDRYHAVGQWLIEGEYCFSDNRKICLKNGEIYPQGSFKLGTVVKPIGQEEFDVDLVFYIPNINRNEFSPEEIKSIIGERLISNGTYKKMLEELKRGWRINYKDEFHLDITPAIPHERTGELVPDSKLKEWKASNPRDYFDWFENISKQMPAFLLTKKGRTVLAMETDNIEELPDNNIKKPLLKRFIQIMKRHRDILFVNNDDKPISIIITTLATHSYRECIKNKDYDNELDLLIDVVKNMPEFIKKVGDQYQILNPTQEEENFAEKWNEDFDKYYVFEEWRKKFLSFVDEFQNISGFYNVFGCLEGYFGKDLVKEISENFIKQTQMKREEGKIITSFGDFNMKKNTFYGS